MRSATSFDRACFVFAPIALVLMINGCGSDAPKYTASVAESDSDANFVHVGSESLSSSVRKTSEGDARAESDATAAVDGSKTESAVKRRIVYTTEIGLVVKDYSAFESLLPSLVNRFDGFVSSSETHRSFNSNQTGIWVVRVPVEHYMEFLQGISGIGFAESRREDAADITDEFVDIQARMRNGRKLEERIIKMLEERTGKLSDVLEIERELARIREEIERMEGRLRVLADRSEMATVTIRCREESQYTPPTAPTLASRLSNTWSNSLNALRFVAENLLLLAVGIFPWAIVLGVPLFLIFAAIRRRMRR